MILLWCSDCGDGKLYDVDNPQASVMSHDPTCMFPVPHGLTCTECWVPRPVLEGELDDDFDKRTYLNANSGF